MPRSRLLAVLVSLSLSLQLVLAGTGATCVDPSAGGERMGMTTNDTEMRGMAMAGHAAESADVGTRSSESRDRRSGTTPCDRAPSSACQPFASCAAGFMVGAASEVIVLHDRPASVRVTELPTLSSRTIAPELPPPRA